MAKSRPKSTNIPPVPVQDEAPYNAIDEEARPGEELETYMKRRDGEEGRAHDANESRHELPDDEFYDVHLGSN